jgi:phage tail sheath protein FI
MTLNDMSAAATIVVDAREAGVGPAATIAVDDSVHSVASGTAHLFRPTGSIASAVLGSVDVKLTTAADAQKFRPGDRITWAGVAAADDNAVIARVRNDTLEIMKPLSANYAAGAAVRLASLGPGTDTVRLEGAAKVAPGMVLLMNQTTPAVVNETVTVASVIVESVSAAITTYRVTLRKGFVTGFDMGGGAVTAQSHEFKITVTPAGGAARVYDELGMDPEHPRYYAKIFTATDPDLTLSAVSPPNTTVPPGNRPATLAATALTAGLPDNPATLTSVNYNDAIDDLQAIDDVNIIAVPDRTDKAVQDKLIGHCTDMQDRFAVLATGPGLEPYGATGSAMAHRQTLASDRGYAALYYPWIEVFDDKGLDLLNVPPVGHVMGIYARTDELRGVHKAPAGLAANVRGAMSVERLVSAVEQGDLNMEGVNVLRVFANGAPPTVWGARTLASGQNGNANWQYINVRRLFEYLEESIQEGLRGAVFEPNNLQLWQKLKRTLTDFLTRSWRDGALFGAKPSEAFYVRIDEVLNPFSEQQLGRLHIEIGVRPSYPAEFIIVRIGIWDGGSEVTEV